MRDLVLIVGFLGLLPLCLMRPSAGLLVWTWFAIMNPHRETYGFAHDLQYNQLIAMATIGGWLFSKERKTPPNIAFTWLFFGFAAWSLVTSALAIVPSAAWEYFFRIPSKVYVYVFLFLVLVTTRARVWAVIWVVCLSLGYFGARNGLVGILTGGSNLGKATGFGPVGSMVEDRNALAIAFVMIIPLLIFLRKHVAFSMMKKVLMIVLVLTVAAVLASYSRGGFLALIAMFGIFWLRSDKKMASAAALLLVLVPAVFFMPEAWRDRMLGISESVETDKSFTHRVSAWVTATNVANDRPLLGGGFKATEQWIIAETYGEELRTPIATHNAYFQMLGDHGYPGLILFLGFIVVALRDCFWIRKHARGRPDLLWAYDLAGVTQASMAGYMVGSMAVSMNYYDGFYIVIGLVFVTRRIVMQELGMLADGRARYGAQIVRAPPRGMVPRGAPPKPAPQRPPGGATPVPAE